MDHRDLHHLIDQFLDNDCTPEEARRALRLMETPEGERYVRQKIDQDIHQLDDPLEGFIGEDVRAGNDRNDPSSDFGGEVDSDRLFGKIEEQMMSAEQDENRGREESPLASLGVTTESGVTKEIGVLPLSGRLVSKKGWDGYSPFFKVAAILLLAFTGSFGHYIWLAGPAGTQQTEAPAAVVYQTEAQQQKRIILGDGTQVRMNQNTEMEVSPDFMTDAREVTLRGEAYFDVAHNEELPFRIDAGKADIEVLGTAFNVSTGHNDFASPNNHVDGGEWHDKWDDNGKGSYNDRWDDNADSGQVQVAVVEGKVSVRSAGDHSGRNSVVLEKGQFGFTDRQLVRVEEFGVDNYLSWMTGRLIFEEQSLTEVCSQLGRLYNISCSFGSDDLKQLRLTTNISQERGPDKLLSVISLSLDLNYTFHNNEVVWSAKEAAGNR